MIQVLSFLNKKSVYLFDAHNDVIETYICTFGNGIGMMINKTSKQNKQGKYLYFVYMISKDNDSEKSKRFKYDLYSTKFIGKYYGYEHIWSLIERFKNL